MNKLDERLLAKFLMNTCDFDEFRKVHDWMEESPKNARELFKTEEVYHLGTIDKISDKEIDKAEKSLFKRLEQEKLKQRKKRFVTNTLRYAAAFIGIFLLGTVGYLSFQPHETVEPLLTVTTQDKIKELMLPDGTKVWLNKNTVLKYPRQFADAGRNIYLEGEGYFEVKKNPQKPFVVQSEAMQVRVLGTVFNLKTNKKNRSAVAMLVEGEIEVKGNHDEGMIILAPGQKAELDGVAKRLVVKQVEGGIENWHDNQFVFDKADIYTIAHILETSYGVKIILAPDIDVQKTYSGILKKKENVQSVLRQIKNSVPIEYKVVGNSVFLSSKK